MAQNILYYPYINIPDGTWLRSAILYWDKISSIVPYSNYAGFSPEILYLQDRDMYEAIYPWALFNSGFEDEFCDTIIRRISVYEKSIRHNQFQKNTERVNVRKSIYAPDLIKLIHYNKIPKKVLDYLQGKNYVGDLNDDGWLKIDGIVAQIYMRTLAEYSIKCSDEDIVLGTDTITGNREIYQHTFPKLDTQCCTINIVDCLPQPSLNVGLEEILDFKERRKDELNAFRGMIRGLEEHLYHANSLEEITFYENEFIEGWETCIGNYKRVLHEANIEFFLGNLCSTVAIPSIGTLLTEHLRPGIASSLQIGTSVLSIALNYINYRNKVCPRNAERGFSYVIKANRDGIIHI